MEDTRTDDFTRGEFVSVDGRVGTVSEWNEDAAFVEFTDRQTRDVTGDWFTRNEVTRSFK